jgi:phosphohistidine swiveling domain-containing protein
VDTTVEARNRYSLTNDDVTELARYAVIIEEHYGRPMDIEWGKDGTDGKLYILQARPETVKSQQQGDKAEQRYKLKGTGTVLAEGRAIGQKIGTGPVRIVHNITEMDTVQPGDVLVTDMTDPNWEPVMKRASAIVTNRGGRTCHAAIIARELGIPAVVGCGNATERLTDGTLVTVACSEGDTGYIYDGLLETEVTEVTRGEMPHIGLKIMMNVGNPQLAFDFCQMPNNGVGLARLEFIINNNIGVHPKAILDYPNIDSDLKKAVESVARGHASPAPSMSTSWPKALPPLLPPSGPSPSSCACRTSSPTSTASSSAAPLRARRRKPHAGLPWRGALHQRRLRRGLCHGMRSAQARAQRHGPDQRRDHGALRAHAQASRARDQACWPSTAWCARPRAANDLRIIMMCEVPSATPSWPSSSWSSLTACRSAPTT